MCLSNPSCFPFSLSTARLQKMESIIRGTGNCPHFCCRQKPMFWLLLCKLSSVIQEGFKAGENGMALFFSMTTTNLRILWVFRSVVCCYFIDRTPPPLLFLKRPNDDFLPNFWQGSHWRQSIALDDYNFFAKMKREMSHFVDSCGQNAWWKQPGNAGLDGNHFHM